ncbi:MAG: nuclear transport factor 2 family protein [Cecembia sp.]
MFKVILTLMAFLAFTALKAQQDIEKIAEQLAQEQLDAYNARDIEAFIIPYAEDVKVFNFPDQLLYQGRDEMYGLYGRMFSRTPELHCKLVNRMVMGNTVIDQEEVTLRKGEPPMRAIAIYKIRDGKIAEVYFIRDE